MEEGITEGGGGFDHAAREIRVCYLIPRIIAAALSGALTGLFALAGAFTGAITGALAGKASNIGVLRGAGLGAIAGAVLSVDVLEASRAYWCSELSSSRSSSSMADFIEELLRGRILEERFPSEILTAYRWQMAVSNIRHGEVYDVNGELVSRGLSVDSLKNLPYHEIKAAQSNCCTICLQVFVIFDIFEFRSVTSVYHLHFIGCMICTGQDIEVGEIVRCLPRCQHMFHLICVDKWLSRHGSCPVCRRDV